MRRSLLLVLGGLVWAGLCGSPLTTLPAAAQPVATIAAAELSAASCDRARAKDDRAAAARVRAGWLDVPGFEPVRIGSGPKIDWTLDPYGHPSWTARFRDLTWVQPLLRRAGGSKADRHRAEAILRDFLVTNPVPAAGVPDPLWAPTLAAKRAETLLCATAVLGAPTWLATGLQEHGSVLSERWSGAWNRGTMEIRALLALGCVTGDAGWVELAEDRVGESFRDELGGPVIAADGSTNEQSLGYAQTVYYLWRQVARDLATCGREVPDVVRDRVPRLLAFLADATMPNGQLVPIGDTFASAKAPGRDGAPPERGVAVYSGGYVFGRVGDDAFYSLRFGPGRQFHGHSDHQALTWYAGGRELLVDSGHTGYLADAYRGYLQSARAHNVLLAAGGPFDPSAPTMLERSRITDTAQYFELTDDAVGATRTRDVLFLQNPDAIIVLDRVRGGPAQRYDQLWHLAPDLEVTDTGANAVRAYAPDGSGLAVLRIPFALDAPGASTDVVRGQRDPFQGWVSDRLGERTPAPVVAFSQSGPDPTFLTVLLAENRDSPVRADFVGAPLLGGVLTLQHGRSQVRIYVGPDGTLSRL